ncbi:MAG: hypothetical protein M0Z52_03980 [Actinomycetota bacterium]|nr:hypothetical protein [Actinomycetota bacterium]
MTKRKKESSLPLFEWVRRAEQLARQSGNPPRGSLDIEKELNAAISEDIRHAQDETGRELSRAEVAARMTDLAGTEITLTTLNNWTAESHPHSIPAKYLPAFVVATGGQRRAAECLSRHSGLFMLPGPEALRAEIQKLDEDISRKKSEKLKRMLFLKEIEHGGSK